MCRMQSSRLRATSSIQPTTAGPSRNKSARRASSWSRYIYRGHRNSSSRQRKEYRGIWQRHLKTRVSDIWLRDVRTYDVNGWLQDIARHNRGLTGSSLQRVKSFISGVFTNAKNQGYFDGVNPVRDADLPKSAPEGISQLSSRSRNQLA
jgi:hypothetical protein